MFYKVIIASLFLVSSVSGQCRQRFSSCYSYPVVQDQIIQQQVYYFVGQPLRIESLMRLENDNQSRLVEELRSELQKYKSQRFTSNQSNNCPTCNANKANNETGNSPPPDPNSINPIVRSSLFSQKCGKCHSGVSPKGQLSLDAAENFVLTAEKFKKARDLVLKGKMPKGGPPLTQPEKDQVIAELSEYLQ